MGNQEIINLDNLVEKAVKISAAMLLHQKKKLGQNKTKYRRVSGANCNFIN